MIYCNNKECNLAHLSNHICYHNAKGLLHRTDGPALILPFQKRNYWYRNGKLHREDGPSVEGIINIWHINGFPIV